MEPELSTPTHRSSVAIQIGSVAGLASSLSPPPLLVGWFEPTSPAALERHLRDALRLEDDEEMELHDEHGVRVSVAVLARRGAGGGGGCAPSMLSLRAPSSDHLQRWSRPFRRSVAGPVCDATADARATAHDEAVAAGGRRRRRRRPGQPVPVGMRKPGARQAGDRESTQVCEAIQVRAAWSDEWLEYEWDAATPTSEIELQLRRILDVPANERQVVLLDAETGELASVAQDNCSLRDGSRYLYAPTMDLSRYSRLMFEESFSSKTQMGILERLAALERSTTFLANERVVLNVLRQVGIHSDRRRAGHTRADLHAHART